MTSFKFNFSRNDEEVNEKEESNSNPVKQEKIQWFECEEVKCTNQCVILDNIASRANMFTCGNIQIGHVIPSEVLSKIGSEKNGLQIAEHNHSDLIPGCYEGGLKVWECTYDLINYLEEHNEKLDGNILDLGCGAGLLGIYGFMKGATVTFQDYNKEVLEYVTIPNVLLNIEEEEKKSEEIERSKFYSGDWSSFNSHLDDGEKFDFILTSETIYNTNNQEKLVDVFAKRLKENGTAYVAAKTYYFGVGGGTRQFEACIEKSGLFVSEVCWNSSGGIQREILKIKRKS